jgi:hypothetical protein
LIREKSKPKQKTTKQKKDKKVKKELLDEYTISGINA